LRHKKSDIFHRAKQVIDTLTREDTVGETELVKIDQSETEVLKCHNTQQNQTLKDCISYQASTSKDHIYIADNVENPDKLTNSKGIHTKNGMPIVKITFNSPSELQKALNIKSFIYMNGDK
jgi:hypothetical protein